MSKSRLTGVATGSARRGGWPTLLAWSALLSTSCSTEEAGDRGDRAADAAVDARTFDAADAAVDARAFDAAEEVDADSDASTDAGPEVPPVGFDVVQPILRAKCADAGCHAEAPCGGSRRCFVEDYSTAYENRYSIRAAIRDGSMPKGRFCDFDPPGSECVDATELATIEAWIVSGAPELSD